jgi:RNA polymerase sigma factor for flagellar operon FliA
MKAALAFDAESEASVDGQGSAKLKGAAPSLETKLRAIDGVLGRVAAAYTTAVSSDDVGGVEGTPVSASPEDIALATERRALTKKALAKLPEQERRLVEGHYVHGRAFDEIAREMGLSKSWASRLHTRALDRLREALAEVS